ncbi:MAG: macrolide ABC transporter ATP-binding protein [Candidatus Yanofskybacteria bacterium CG10_big_fil_rev_8_21_14_0_10_37_15]|uniref:Macrolide ABC transporter ATP-binding protein n=1 Tax=Candidatus Yanofskybacteria bacterium CG10_big_fil_rev_8_21_14_0_10_37_15 TaxID=1975097 RepID=A0A2H0R683_9BACT|nr:MAG: macrolide ABC transporter ATP-binding protein [Candidatus Yanofskybacteria bacterium CG10_big_fil_rev_8_21_14_0_10_37_15]
MHQVSKEHLESVFYYIQDSQKNGFSNQSIVESLKKAGWTEVLVELGFSSVVNIFSEYSQEFLSANVQNVIEINDVQKEYFNGEEKTFALRGIKLQIQKGDFVTIMGPSGSGKSTLMHILGLLDVPSSGHYKFAGREVINLTSSEQAKVRNQKVGFVFQQFNLMPRTTVLDNVLLPTTYKHIPEAKQRAVWIIERVSLLDKMHHKGNQLSGGQIQRVAVARALMMNPEIILADEPTGNLDSVTSEGILSLFKEINENGTTIIMVTHEEHIANHAKRIIRLKDGEIVSDERLLPI